MTIMMKLMVAAAAVVGMACASTTMEIGVGIYDMTGPIENVNMMGMANPDQKAKGMSQRLRSRAFVARDTTTNKHIAFVSMDAGMGSLVINNRVIDYLNNNSMTKGIYTLQNVALSGTHTHSGPSGFLEEMIFQFAGSGFVSFTINSFVTGVAESIIMAHKNLAPASGSVAIGELAGANINRSPTAYANNTQEERDRYDHNTDLNMTVLKLTAADGQNIGMFNWFAVHGTSLNNTNVLTSGDNKGYASYVVEKQLNGPTEQVAPGSGKFVAAFAATNLGDVSPNTQGAHCQDTGLPCDQVTSTCNGRTELCVAAGPGKDMFESTQIIGQKQADKAVELFNMEGQPLTGSIDFAHIFVQMPGLAVNDHKTGEPVGTLCKPAMGDSFAGGTTDGPGQFNFKQGNGSNPIWNDFGQWLTSTTPVERACQFPKPILLNTGNVKIPFPWGPDILPVQLLKLGNLVIISVPTEMTTMAGRRTRKEIKRVLVESNVIGEDGVVVIAGLTNAYADYTTTYEEFCVQRYEGGSTIFGPHQLNGYIQELSKLARNLNSSTPLPPGPSPNDFSKEAETNVITGFLHEGVSNTSNDGVHHSGDKFGAVVSGKDVTGAHAPGSVVSVTFNGANPLNDDMRRQDTYFKVQRCVSSTSCVTVATDDDWETTFTIASGHIIGVHMEIWREWTMNWAVPIQAQAGQYRIEFSGRQCLTNILADSSLLGKRKCKNFTGSSSMFTIANSTFNSV